MAEKLLLPCQCGNKKIYFGFCEDELMWTVKCFRCRREIDGLTGKQAAAEWNRRIKITRSLTVARAYKVVQANQMKFCAQVDEHLIEYSEVKTIYN